MGSGINLPNLLEVTTSTTIEISSSGIPQVPDIEVPVEVSSWKPPQYSKPALTVLTVPSQTSSTSGETTFGSISYVFDAVLRIDHNLRSKKTQHPVLTGANITDHVYSEPARIALEIGMSDAMAAYDSSMWVGADTKSVSAWQTMVDLKEAKTLFTLTTRLDTYFNMVIVEMRAPDDHRTKHGLRATIVLEEILSASVFSQPSSSTRPQTTDSTSNGVIQSVPPSASQVQQNVIPSDLWPNTPSYPNVPGAGRVSSNSLGQVPQGK